MPRPGNGAGSVTWSVGWSGVRLQVGGGRGGRGPAAGPQNIAALLNYNRCRCLTSVHEVHRRNLYRLSVASHGYTYYLNRYLCFVSSSVRRPRPDRYRSSRGIFSTIFKLSA